MLKRNQLDWLMLLCMNATVTVVLVWKTHLGEIPPSVALISAPLCLLLLNFVIIIAVRKRNHQKGQPTSKRLVPGAIGLSAMAALVTSVLVFAVPQRNNYVDLALSAIPLSNIQPEQKRLVVELIRRRTANSREYEKRLADAKAKPLSPSLYTPESFANPEVIESTIAQLKKYADADFEYSQKQRAVASEFRQKMAKVDPDFLRSWDIERQGQEAAEQRATDLEHEWLESTASLYRCAESHSGDISLKSGHLEFARDAVRLEFSNKQDESKSLYRKWQDVLQALARRQQQARANVGLPHSL